MVAGSGGQTSSGGCALNGFLDLTSKFNKHSLKTRCYVKSPLPAPSVLQQSQAIFERTMAILADGRQREDVLENTSRQLRSTQVIDEIPKNCARAHTVLWLWWRQYKLHDSDY